MESMMKENCGPVKERDKESILFRQVDEVENKMLQLFGKYPDIIGALSQVVNPKEIYKNLGDITNELEVHLKEVTEDKGATSLDFRIFAIKEKLRVLNVMIDKLAEHVRMI